MDSFDRVLHEYQKTAGKLKSLNSPVQFQVRKKKYQMQIIKGEIDVKELP
jgi:hypothetical protein